MRRLFQFRLTEDAYILYVNEQPSDMRVYPTHQGDEPVMLSPDGRIVPSIVWYGEGGPDQTKRRRYTSPEAALEGELEIIQQWTDEEEEEDEEDEESLPSEYHTFKLIFKAIDIGHFAILLGENERTGVDTGFTAKKSEEGPWQVWYDGAVWGVAKEWNQVHAVMVHIELYVGAIIGKGPKALKDFIAPFSWQAQDQSWVLLDHGRPSGFIVRPSGSNYLCC
jgi:hypothetical protein